ncbi:PREDICTED: uncharacterized protein LOC104784556 [Camelina sativa]|uniref:Uncharacterized protein LOC104784556 n=1 Tax=Camelina sativa TaxID=90675 RepID=A0ABM0YYF4_CAMSA|nr:PREDICTED: uncharacterized protein LOC104784556 [Camelina sativa]
MSPSCCCGKRSVAFFFLFISAVPIAYLVSLERAVPSTHVISYHSSGFLRECAKWDDVGRRFLVSYMDGGGGIGELVVPSNSDSEDVLEELTLVKDLDLSGNSSNGFIIDRHRNRLLLAVADLLGNRFSALVAYDLSTWRRLFLTVLSSQHSKEISYADDVAVDAQGNAYVTDAKGGKIWKLDLDGKLVSIIRSHLFVPPASSWYFNNFVSLNGIVYHPDGFLIVIHTFSGSLFKIDVSNDADISSRVTVIDVSGGSLRFGDGLELLSPSKIVVAGSPSSKLVESSDGWRTASVTGWFSSGMVHRLVSSATVKEGRVYLNHIVGFGSKKRHILVEAVF